MEINKFKPNSIMQKLQFSIMAILPQLVKIK
ncbi:hypothetical protein J2Y60_003800 [Arcicella sp. BE140]|nr:hypothetical protein [Arcicella sp. BE51]MDR6813588.1 hypothetical protein [Arcicella sp. BE140]MDR6824900.1 hypothetical protein [Arcicella sp. BE139]